MGIDSFTAALRPFSYSHTHPLHKQSWQGHREDLSCLNEGGSPAKGKPSVWTADLFLSTERTS